MPYEVSKQTDNNVSRRKMKVQLDPGAYMPTRSYPTDAGADLRTPHRFILRAGEYKVIDTGVHTEK